MGSGYVHFNYTPDGDKATASMIGDVPRGVMLNQPRVFLGGQGGMVGPRRVDYGTVVAAGVILREDIETGHRLVWGRNPPEGDRDLRPGRRAAIARLARNNLLYLAHLVALEEWYRHVRRPFFLRQEFGSLILAGAMHNLARAKQERLQQLEALADRASRADTADSPSAAGKRELRDAADALRELFASPPAIGEDGRHGFLKCAGPGEPGAGYLEFIRNLPEETRACGVRWLQSMVDGLCAEAQRRIPSLRMFP